jgi:hypothetical protein
MTGINAFRLLLAMAWVLVIYVSVHAVSTMGAGTAGAIFFGDMSHPWRGQFNTDFGLHLLMVGAWMIYRARTLALGLLWGVLAVVLGGAFTFAYLLIVSVQVEGDARKLLLGRHAL